MYPWFPNRIARQLNARPALPFWPRWQTFRKLRAEVREQTLVGRRRCFMLYALQSCVNAVPGDLAEVGVYRGGTACLLARAAPNKSLVLFDTFEGMPKVDAIDVHRAGDFADTSLEGVKKFLADCPNAIFAPGFFPETAAPHAARAFSFVHVDVDIYQSNKDALAFFWPRLSPGGLMVFDDYLWRRCPGVAKAIDEFVAANPAARLLPTTEYQCLLQKPPA